MIYPISTPPGHSALAFHAFDDRNCLQSNARITSYLGKPSSHGETQIGLGILFGSSDSLPRVNDLEDLPPFLDSSQPPARTPLSPTETLRLRCSPTPGDECQVIDTDFNTSSSAFSITDWIVNPSSSPAPSDALYGPSTAPHQFESPRTAAGIHPAVLVSPRTRTSPTNTNGAPETMETAFLQVVERICFSRIPITTCLSPSQTLIPRRNYVSPDVSNFTSAQPPAIVFAGSDFGQQPGDLFSAPIVTSNELASTDFFTVGTASVSPRDALPSNGYAKGPLVSPDTPAFNIHEGISEYDLQRRANRYRRRYPGRSLDRHWLLKYAGKLNKDGKAMEDYRCYISGCTQVNKRRDHIMVHICSHVNERPFACRYCHMTFLRRNECKRHEAGHSGLKPFVCRLCPPPAARFARQDLLTRHARRAHDATGREQGEKSQQTPEMAVPSRSEPVRKRARMAALRPRTSREACS
ncbi:hypothetical protein BJV74DRAFT_805732 [Russula compacta]|nr:hypothetical protein BJV74DRAFT_805732 [Russula compacta]